MLSVEDVEFAYGVTPILRGVSLRVDKAEAVALLGTNGSGKSTLIGVIGGLLRARGGRVFVDGVDVTRTRADQRVRNGLVVVRGGRGIFPDLTVAENLTLQAHTCSRDRRTLATGSALDLFPVLAKRLSVSAGLLSGGEQQQLALAKAVQLEPAVVCIDELSLGLAPPVVAELIDVIRSIRNNGTALLIVDQSLEVAGAICEKAVFLEQGSIRFNGSMQGLLARADLLRSVLLVGAAR